MVIKKVWFSNLEILEIHQQINRETFQQDSISVTETINTEKHDPSNRIEMQSNCNRNSTQPNSEQTIKQEEKMNVLIMNIIMSKKKTTLLTLRNQDWKKSLERN